METEAINEELIVRYLLGDLPEEEQVLIEDRAFSDRECARAIVAVENDLIDEYARGELSDADRRRFERRFLVSAERRRKVEFARALATLVPEATTADADQPAAERTMDFAPASWLQSLKASLNRLNPAFKISIVAGATAAAMLLIGVSWLISETARLRAQVAQLQAERQARQDQEESLRQQTAAERARSEGLVSQLQRERERRERSEELARQLERDHPREGSNGLSIIASVFLAPGLPRGDANRPKLLVPQAARLARIQIGLEREDEYKSFRVELRTAKGQEVWTQDDLRPRPSRAGRVLNLVVPGNVLGAGEYELALKGVIDQQKTEDVRYYYFDALKK
jgi:anti-sigma factor RsiW